MHVYIYDSYVNQKKHERIIAKIETRITDLGLNGKIIRLGPLNSVFDAIYGEIKKGAKTIIAVGDNKILHEAINAVAISCSKNNLVKNIPLGFIPIGKKNNSIATLLGINIEEASCNTLSARRIQELDLGLANKTLFLTQAQINTDNTSIKIDGNFSIEVEEQGEINLVNIPFDKNLSKNTSTNPRDGKLDFFINTKKKNKLNIFNDSKISFKSIVINNKYNSVLVDNVINLKAPVNITIAKEKINLIIGKNRNFN